MTLGVHQYESSGEVRGVLRCRAFDNHHIVKLRAGDYIERKSSRIRFGTWHRASVKPHIIISLSQAAYHYKLVVYYRYTRNASYDLGGILILCLGYLLSGDAVLYNRTVLLLLNLRHLAILTGDCRHRDSGKGLNFRCHCKIKMYGITRYFEIRHRQVLISYIFRYNSISTGW